MHETISMRYIEDVAQFAFSKLSNDNYRLIQTFNMIVIKPWHREIKSLSQRVKQNPPFSSGYRIFVQKDPISKTSLQNIIISGLAPHTIQKFYFEFSEQGHLSFSAM